jgi:hypothetical protein
MQLPSAWQFLVGPGAQPCRCLAQIRWVGGLLSLFAYFTHFDSIPIHFLYVSCKIMILQYMWNKVNISNICVLDMLVLLFFVSYLVVEFGQ